MYRPEALNAEAGVTRSGGRKLAPASYIWLCGHGGIGRRAGFRFQWATVQVQVLLAAFFDIITVCRQE